MNRKNSWLYVLIIALACSATAAGVHHLPVNFHAALFFVAISLTGWMLTQSWKWQRNHATVAWMYFLSSLLTILLLTDSISHLTGV